MTPRPGGLTVLAARFDRDALAWQVEAATPGGVRYALTVEPIEGRVIEAVRLGGGQ